MSARWFWYDRLDGLRGRGGALGALGGPDMGGRLTTEAVAPGGTGREVEEMEVVVEPGGRALRTKALTGRRTSQAVSGRSFM